MNLWIYEFINFFSEFATKYFLSDPTSNEWLWLFYFSLKSTNLGLIISFLFSSSLCLDGKFLSSVLSLRQLVKLFELSGQIIIIFLAK